MYEKEDITESCFRIHTKAHQYIWIPEERLFENIWFELFYIINDSQIEQIQKVTENSAKYKFQLILSKNWAEYI